MQSHIIDANLYRNVYIIDIYISIGICIDYLVAKKPHIGMSLKNHMDFSLACPLLYRAQDAQLDFSEYFDAAVCGVSR